MDSPIIVALDLVQEEALALANKLKPEECRLKIGSQLFTQSNDDLLLNLQDMGFDIFLDLKFHDIPNTVKEAVLASQEMGVWMTNVHALGGREMLKAARLELYPKEQSSSSLVSTPLLIGVTILTSLDRNSLDEIGFKRGLEDQVLHLAKICKQEGLDGVVCSPREITKLRHVLGKEFLLVVPGIRSESVVSNDQKRTDTPVSAIEDGADYIVIGREITLDKNPDNKVKEILDSISK